MRTGLKSDVLITDSHEPENLTASNENEEWPGWGGFIVRHNFVVMKKAPEKSLLRTTLIPRLLISVWRHKGRCGFPVIPI